MMAMKHGDIGWPVCQRYITYPRRNVKTYISVYALIKYLKWYNINYISDTSLLERGVDIQTVH